MRRNWSLSFSNQLTQKWSINFSITTFTIPIHILGIVVVVVEVVVAAAAAAVVVVVVVTLLSST